MLSLQMCKVQIQSLTPPQDGRSLPLPGDLASPEAEICPLLPDGLAGGGFLI